MSYATCAEHRDPRAGVGYLVCVGTVLKLVSDIITDLAAAQKPRLARRGILQGKR